MFLPEATHMMWHPKDWSGTQWSPDVEPWTMICRCAKWVCHVFTHTKTMCVYYIYIYTYIYIYLELVAYCFNIIISLMHTVYMLQVHIICLQTSRYHFSLDFYIKNELRILKPFRVLEFNSRFIIQYYGGGKKSCTTSTTIHLPMHNLHPRPTSSMLNDMLTRGARFPSLAQIHFDHCVLKQY